MNPETEAVCPYLPTKKNFSAGHIAGRHTKFAGRASRRENSRAKSPRPCCKHMRLGYAPCNDTISFPDSSFPDVYSL